MSEQKKSMDFNRLKWHCRRGMLELDLLLEPFLEEEFNSLNQFDKQCFEKLIEVEDQDMFSWFMQSAVPSDPELTHIVNIILNRVQPQNYRN